MKIIAVCSFKGGTGKTSTALNIGAALAKFHRKKVLLVDFDAQANLSTGCGFDPDGQDSLAPVLQGTKEISEVICETQTKKLHLIPSDSYLERVETTGKLASDRYSHEKLKNTLQSLDYDYVFIDTPPSLSWLTESAMIAATHCLVCATPEFYSIKGLTRLSQFMDQIASRHPFSILGIVLSFWNSRGKSNEAFLEVIDSIFPNKTFKTKVRRDIIVSEASAYGQPTFMVNAKSRASEDYKLLTKEIKWRSTSTVNSEEQHGKSQFCTV